MNQETISSIKDAITKEKASYTFYILLMNNTENTILKELFRNIALQEIKHEELMKEVLKTGNIPDAKQRVSERHYSFEDKMIKNSIAGFNKIPISQGIETAIKREQAAQVLYTKLMERAETSEGKLFFQAISDEEKIHEELLRKEYLRL